MQTDTDTDLPSADALLDFLKPAAQVVIQDPFQKTDEKTLKAWIEVFIVLNALQNKLKDRLDKVLKPCFHEAAKGVGVENDKGGFEIAIDGLTLLREKRTASEPDEEKLKALLKTRGLKVEDCFDVQKTVVLNPSKLRLLVDLGQLDEAEVLALHDVGWAIKGIPNKTLKEKIETLFKKARKKPAAKTRK